MLDYLVDHLGMVVWLFLLFVAIMDLLNPKLKRWPRIVLLFIAVNGILLDALLLVAFYFNIKGGFWFDFLGLFVFSYICWLGYKDMNNKVLKKQIRLRLVLFLVGTLGFLADLTVLLYFLLSGIVLYFSVNF